MKITRSEEIALDNAKLTVTINLEIKQPAVELSYTCPKCDGWRCNSHSQNNPECNGGSVYIKIEQGKLDSVVGVEMATSIRNILKAV